MQGRILEELAEAGEEDIVGLTNAIVASGNHAPEAWRLIDELVELRRMGLIEFCWERDGASHPASHSELPRLTTIMKNLAWDEDDGMWRWRQSHAAPRVSAVLTEQGERALLH